MFDLMSGTAAVPVTSAWAGPWEEVLDFVPAAWLPVIKAGAWIVAILAGALVVYLLARRGLGHARERGSLPEPVEVVARLLLRWTIIVVALLLILQRVGVLANAWGVLSAALALVAIGFFAVWSVLSNLLCALMLVVVKPFRVGDTIEVCGDGLQGKVIDLNFAFVTLREDGGALIRVPNNQFFQKSIRCQPGEERIDLAEQLTADEPKE